MPESRRTFGEQLDEIRGEVVKLAVRSCEQIGAATQALLDADLELTTGLMRNVARACRRLYPRELPPRIRGIIERMGAQASVQMHLAVDAFADGDERLASALPDMDDVMDDLQKELFRAIFAGFSGAQTDEAALQMAVQLAFVGRDYERAADHAVMIGRWVEFMITGQLPGEAEIA
jgi:phosphate transport system protein